MVKSEWVNLFIHRIWVLIIMMGKISHILLVSGIPLVYRTAGMFVFVLTIPQMMHILNLNILLSILNPYLAINIFFLLLLLIVQLLVTDTGLLVADSS